MGLKDFFTHEAGQRRRAWLEDQEQRAAESLRYALGPQLYPRVDALANVAALFSPGQDVIDVEDDHSSGGSTGPQHPPHARAELRGGEAGRP